MDAQRDDAAGDGGHYGSHYYEHCCGAAYGRDPAWLRLFEKFADRIVSEIAPGSVLDAGCAMGLLVESLADRGVDAHGIDISSYAISKVRPDIADRCRVGSILEPFGRRYDLIISVEVVEHLRPEDAERAIDNFCAHADDVILSTTPYDYKEATHYNVQPPEYWAELFARRGYYRDLDHDASYITRWAARYRKRTVSAPRLVMEYERKLWRFAQEALGARESLVEHQDALVLAREASAIDRSRCEAMEAESLRFDARMAERYAAEAALAMEFDRAVTAWSEHARGQDERFRQAVAMMAHKDREIEGACRDLAETKRTECDLWARVQALWADVESSRAEIDSLRAERDALRAECQALQASGAWRLVQGLSAFRRRLAPDGTRRKRAIGAIRGWRNRRRDQAHDHGPSTARSGERVGG